VTDVLQTSIQLPTVYICSPLLLWRHPSSVFSRLPVDHGV